ncbi:heat shock protein beta-1 isoform X3 [Anopheles nili]|uniref:heat shock protein beta-1 isoform X3 n=1 Tax=Anopheles nili TaxID=185578 RepID=UPI00237BB368|nr:heat shock protein beta-1 isoform X3 [Anopheles nili]
MADEENRRNIPIKLGDFSVIDTEFSSIRERFDSEMRKMEEEMARFRSDLMNRESNFFETTFSSKKVATSTSASNAASSLKHPQVQSGSGISSPLIQDDGDGKVLKLRFDVSQYAPEEIVVKTIDNKLYVSAKHMEKSDTKTVYREYNREFVLPKGCLPENIRSSLSKDGVLTVDAPMQPEALLGGETMVPIAHN